MPLQEAQVEAVNLSSDMNSYYAGTIVTHGGLPAKVIEFYNNGDALMASIHTLSRGGHWSEQMEVSADSLDTSMPRLGFVRINRCWIYLSRNPQRRMRKGYHSDLIKYNTIGDPSLPSVSIMDRSILLQLWFGSEHRISHKVVLHNNSLYFELEAVAHIQGENVQLIEGKEKLGEYACKLWHNNLVSNN